MRDVWYADNRDLAKWGVLLRLAEVYDVATILQVAYYRPTQWAGLEIGGKSCTLPSAVIDHFRRKGNTIKLKSNAKVIVLDTEFRSGDRSGYLEHVLEQVGALPKQRAIVFLDPDTGLEPKRKAGPQHVSQHELRAIWDALRSDDVLVFYQHRMRSRLWLQEKKTQFEKVLGLDSDGSNVAQGKQMAPDVAFFYCQKAPTAALRDK